jgi:hypothetical protein
MAPHAVVALLPRRRPPDAARFLRGGAADAARLPPPPLAAARSFAFWTRVARIYSSYKLAQLRAGLMRAQARLRRACAPKPRRARQR